MTAQEAAAEIDTAREQGYTLIARHQPAVEMEEPEWIVVIRTPDGRTLFPAAIDADEPAAWARAAARVQADRADRLE